MQFFCALIVLLTSLGKGSLKRFRDEPDSFVPFRPYSQRVVVSTKEVSSAPTIPQDWFESHLHASQPIFKNAIQKTDVLGFPALEFGRSIPLNTKWIAPFFHCLYELKQLLELVARRISVLYTKPSDYRVSQEFTDSTMSLSQVKLAIQLLRKDVVSGDMNGFDPAFAGYGVVHCADNSFRLSDDGIRQLLAHRSLEVDSAIVASESGIPLRVDPTRTLETMAVFRVILFDIRILLDDSLFEALVREYVPDTPMSGVEILRLGRKAFHLVSFPKVLADFLTANSTGPGRFALIRKELEGSEIEWRQRFWVWEQFASGVMNARDFVILKKNGIQKLLEYINTSSEVPVLRMPPHWQFGSLTNVVKLILQSAITETPLVEILALAKSRFPQISEVCISRLIKQFAHMSSFVSSWAGTTREQKMAMVPPGSSHLDNSLWQRKVWLWDTFSPLGIKSDSSGRLVLTVSGKIALFQFILNQISS